MISAFGVEHSVSKRDSDRTRHYGQMAASTGTVGAGSALLGAGTAAVGLSEKAGKDPFGLSQRKYYNQKPLSSAAKKKLLRPIGRTRLKHSKYMLGLGAAGLGASHVYQRERRKELAKRDDRTKSERKKALAVAVGGGAVSGTAAGLGSHWSTEMKGGVRRGIRQAREAHHVVAGQKLGALVTRPGELQFNRAKRAAGVRSVALKVPAAALAGTTVAAGGAGLYELGRRHIERGKRGTKKVAEKATRKLT